MRRARNNYMSPIPDIGMATGCASSTHNFSIIAATSIPQSHIRCVYNIYIYITNKIKQNTLKQGSWSHFSCLRATFSSGQLARGRRWAGPEAKQQNNKCSFSFCAVGYFPHTFAYASIQASETYHQSLRTHSSQVKTLKVLSQFVCLHSLSFCKDKQNNRTN